MDFLSFLQWPAMVVTTASVWLCASQTEAKRNWGFRCSLVSNALWIAWGFHDGAWALIGLQVCLIALNVRGILKNDDTSGRAVADSNRGGASQLRGNS